MWAVFRLRACGFPQPQRRPVPRAAGVVFAHYPAGRRCRRRRARCGAGRPLLSSACGAVGGAAASRGASEQSPYSLRVLRGRRARSLGGHRDAGSRPAGHRAACDDAAMGALGCVRVCEGSPDSSALQKTTRTDAIRRACAEHVGHLRRHPMQYVSALSSWLDAARRVWVERAAQLGCDRVASRL